MRKEHSVLNYIQDNLHTARMDRVMPVITHLADGGIAWFIVCALLACREKTRMLSFSILVSLAIEALVCNLIIKPAAQRKRPCDLNPDVPLLIRRPTDPSFPSGHTGASFAAVAALYMAHHVLWIPSCILACMIGYSRIYLYVHYPSDVIIGAILGIMAAIMAQPLLLYLLAV